MEEIQYMKYTRSKMGTKVFFKNLHYGRNTTH